MVITVSRIAALAKALFYQGNINTYNMQGTGFSWIVRPILDNDGIELSTEDSARLGEYFNTNPSFVTLVAGIFLKEYRSGRKAFVLKKIYSSAFAALGDSFFWHGLRPLLFMVTLFICTLISPWGVVIYPIAYSSFHLMFLVFGGIVGETLGEHSIIFFNRVSFNRWADFADSASLFILGALLTCLIKNSYSGGFKLPAVAAFFFITGAAVRKYVRLPVFLWGVAVVVLVLLGFYGGYELWAVR